MRTEDAMTAPAAPHAVASDATAVPRIGMRPHPALPWLLLSDGLPAQVLSETSLVKVPNTRPWLRGVVSQRGNLLPVFDLAEWAGHGRTTTEDNRSPIVVAIGVGADAFALLSHRAPGLVRITQGDAAAIESDHDHGPLSDYLGRALRVASGVTDTGHAYPFDARRWLGDIAQHISRAD